jgi:hypothetical protein
MEWWVEVSDASSGMKIKAANKEVHASALCGSYGVFV